MTLKQRVINFWDWLPREFKIPFYYAGSYALYYVAELLLSLEPIDWRVALRLLIGNMVVVFLRNAKPRVDSYRDEKIKVSS